MTDSNDPVVRGYLLQLIGEEGIEMIENMPEGEVTDEQIAEASGVMLNIVRRTLFIMNENNLAVCRRERDSSSGWLTYLWQLDLSDIESHLVKEKKRITKNLEIRYNFEVDSVFYTCPEGCVRFEFKEASKCEFMCPACGEDMMFEDNSVMVKKLRDRLDALEASS
ncbi:transcription factor [Methanococcoides burtonii]|uniref:Transcription factor E n=1 Tax=Methanococcoides burtonii (strain DSM 6242 / NBRC 107633 / OCM 468 / ACE-M) TaxID=259564 RepID=TFE_METBU|nr:transcription factor [Methanococcoides burtonii]Q12YV9.1 RecName: Full=Transcription factor E; Short=TFE; AltName: Full=TFIIE subunit alpha homolog; AltName: Full=Transcription initiation factor TFIIE [Methanococcoides burtonii DSM 6242]ABE51367.1 Transcription Factor E [Methanococcoides burtonii DSM 6242]